MTASNNSDSITLPAISVYGAMISYRSVGGVRISTQHLVIGQARVRVIHAIVNDKADKKPEITIADYRVAWKNNRRLNKWSARSRGKQLHGGPLCRTLNSLIRVAFPSDFFHLAIDPAAGPRRKSQAVIVAHQAIKSTSACACIRIGSRTLDSISDSQKTQHRSSTTISTRKHSTSQLGCTTTTIKICIAHKKGFPDQDLYICRYILHQRFIIAA